MENKQGKMKFKDDNLLIKVIRSATMTINVILKDMLEILVLIIEVGRRKAVCNGATPCLTIFLVSNENMSFKFGIYTKKIKWESKKFTCHKKSTNNQQQLINDVDLVVLMTWH